MTLKSIKTQGGEQYNKFVQDRLIDCITPLTDTIERNKLVLFKDRHKISNFSKDKLKLKSSKNDCQLFSRLYIGCQNRGGNLDNFFEHENQVYPPSISDGGLLRQGSKSDLLHCFDELNLASSDEPNDTAVFFDGAALVHILKPVIAKTFDNYSCDVFVPRIIRCLERVIRIDVVWDVYVHGSLKTSTRQKRGMGNRRQVMPHARIPQNWQGLVNENKIELFKFWAEKLTQNQVSGKQIFATHGPNVISAPVSKNVSVMSHSTHEDADTRIFLHCLDASKKGHNKIMIRTVDIDVVVLAIPTFQELALEELWIAFGTGNNFRYLPIHYNAVSLGPAKSAALPLFQGKVTAWRVWSSSTNNSLFSAAKKYSFQFTKVCNSDVFSPIDTCLI